METHLTDGFGGGAHSWNLGEPPGYQTKIIFSQYDQEQPRIDLATNTLDWYLDHRRDEVRMATRRKLESSLGTFVDWTDKVSVEDMTEMGPPSHGL